jgi:sec-independent protein translocase protein TatA
VVTAGTVFGSRAIAFFGIGDTEILIIMVAILIFFGGERLPELARGLGKALRELRRATSDVEREFKRLVNEAEHSVAEPITKAAASIVPQTTQPKPENGAPEKKAPPPPPPEPHTFHSDI